MYWTSLSFLSCLFIYRDEIDVYKDTEKMNRQEKVKERGEYSVTLTEHARSLLLCMATTASILWDDLLCAFLVSVK